MIQLPTDIHEHILSLLGGKDVATMTKVSKGIHGTANGVFQELQHTTFAALLRELLTVYMSYDEYVNDMGFVIICGNRSTHIVRKNKNLVCSGDSTRRTFENIDDAMAFSLTKSKRYDIRVYDGNLLAYHLHHIAKMVHPEHRAKYAKLLDMKAKHKQLQFTYMFQEYKYAKENGMVFMMYEKDYNITMLAQNDSWVFTSVFQVPAGYAETVEKRYNHLKAVCNGWNAPPVGATGFAYSSIVTNKANKLWYDIKDMAYKLCEKERMIKSV